MTGGADRENGGENGRPLDRRRLLANLEIFSSLDERSLDALVRATSTRRLGSGEVLFRKGEAGRQLYGVLSGRVKAVASGADGKEIVFNVCDPGEVIGEIALLDSNPRSATIVAIEPSELLVLDRRDFFPFLEKHPRVAIELAELLAARLRRLSELAEDSVLLALRARLAKKLVSLAQRYARKTREGIEIDLPLSQQELGEMVGTSRESINKQLRAWAEQGLIISSKGRITLCDVPGLEALARLAID
ncbi:MAG TPA: Crp/Fnr family transcriptional regulator [Myxococcota bacterium]|nr:Crp/Fnr family transcriptional regulator [Myxococcota bacterium]